MINVIGFAGRGARRPFYRLLVEISARHGASPVLCCDGAVTPEVIALALPTFVLVHRAGNTTMVRCGDIYVSQTIRALPSANPMRKPPRRFLSDTRRDGLHVPRNQQRSATRILANLRSRQRGLVNGRSWPTELGILTRARFDALAPKPASDGKGFAMETWILALGFCRVRRIGFARWLRPIATSHSRI
jgi:hypothetical protein